MFGAIGRYLRAFGYLVTGRIDRARKELSRNPDVVSATYDRIVREKTDRMQQYKNAVASMIAQEEKKTNTVKRLTEEVKKLERLKEGAAAKAKSVVAKLKASGASQEAIRADEDYKRCLSAFNDFSSTLAEKNEHLEELERDITEIGENISNHKIQLQGLLREIAKLKEEAHSTVADMIAASEEEKIADMLSGISDDRTSKELQELRDLRDQQKSKARIARELAGTDTKRQEAEFLEYAQSTVSTDEFDQLIGLAGEVDSQEGEEPGDRTKTQLPEG